MEWLGWLPSLRATRKMKSILTSWGLFLGKEVGCVMDACSQSEKVLRLTLHGFKSLILIMNISRQLLLKLHKQCFINRHGFLGRGKKKSFLLSEDKKAKVLFLLTEGDYSKIRTVSRASSRSVFWSYCLWYGNKLSPNQFYKMICLKNTKNWPQWACSCFSTLYWYLQAVVTLMSSLFLNTKIILGIKDKCATAGIVIYFWSILLVYSSR